MRDFDADKRKVLDWMEKNANGYRHARTREDILPFIRLEDRYFRLLVADLIKEGHIASSARSGYWFIPLATTDRNEIEAVKGALLERKSKALSMLEDISGQITSLDQKLQKINQGQEEFSYGQAINRQ